MEKKNHTSYTKDLLFETLKRDEAILIGEYPKINSYCLFNLLFIVTDAIRFLKLCHDLGMKGPILPVAAVYCKTPPIPMKYEDAKDACDSLAKTKIFPQLYEEVD